MTFTSPVGLQTSESQPTCHICSARHVGVVPIDKCVHWLETQLTKPSLEGRIMSRDVALHHSYLHEK